jgi:methyl-accepting chemotaxis protein
VEETTSASQSMKDQAKELMRQMAVFKVTGAGTVSPKPRAKKPLGGAKPAEAKEPVGVGAPNGKDHRHTEAEFEEF